MFQESLLLAVKLLVVACVAALVCTLLLTRAACARLVAASDADAPGDGEAPRRHRPGIEASIRKPGVHNVNA
jgi:hypothetical protein